MDKNKMVTEGMRLVEAFSTSAQNHGWQADQGWGNAPAEAQSRFEADREALENYIRQLAEFIANS